MERLTVELPQLKESTITSSSSMINKGAELASAVRRNMLSLPKRFREKTLDNFIGYQEKVEIGKQAIQNDRSLLIVGDCGTGKTHLACGLLYDWYVSKIKMIQERWIEGMTKTYPKTPCFLPSVEFFFELKAGFDNKVPESEIIDKYSRVEILCLDDLGAEKISDWSRQVCYMLIDRRYRDMKQTIITSNLSMEELAKNIDERITSRIVEMGVVMKLDGTDKRLDVKNG